MYLVKKLPTPKFINLDKEYVKTVADLAKSVYPTQIDETTTILLAMESGKFNKVAIGDTTLFLLAKELDIEYNLFNAILRKLKAVGILYKKGRTFYWSKQFQNRLMKISILYEKMSKKGNPLLEVIRDYRDYIEKKGLGAKFEPVFSEDE